MGWAVAEGSGAGQGGTAPDLHCLGATPHRSAWCDPVGRTELPRLLVFQDKVEFVCLLIRAFLNSSN